MLVWIVRLLLLLPLGLLLFVFGMTDAAFGYPLMVCVLATMLFDLGLFTGKRRAPGSAIVLGTIGFWFLILATGMTWSFADYLREVGRDAGACPDGVRDAHVFLSSVSWATLASAALAILTRRRGFWAAFSWWGGTFASVYVWCIGWGIVLLGAQGEGISGWKTTPLAGCVALAVLVWLARRRSARESPATV